MSLVMTPERIVGHANRVATANHPDCPHASGLPPPSAPQPVSDDRRFGQAVPDGPLLRRRSVGLRPMRVGQVPARCRRDFLQRGASSRRRDPSIRGGGALNATQCGPLLWTPSEGGQKECQPCGANTYYHPDGNRDNPTYCLPCIPGAFCVAGVAKAEPGEMTALILSHPDTLATRPAGFFISYAPNASDNYVEAMPCLPGLCIGCTTNGTEEGAVQPAASCCSEDRAPSTPTDPNPMCGRCREGLNAVGTRCLQCPAPRGERIFLVLLLSFVLVFLFHLLCGRRAAPRRARCA
jgi:hypothetical protein